MKKISFLLLLFLLLYCTPDNDAPVQPMENVEQMEQTEQMETMEEVIVNDFLTQSTPYSSYTGSSLKSFSTIAVRDVLPYDFMDVTSVVIHYNTVNEENKPIQASGVIIFPENEGNYELVSVQHGTISSNENAPSNSSLGFNELTIGAIIAGTGFICLVPDYIGYGINNNSRHPYEHRKSLAQNTTDMILAAKEYLEQEAIEYTDQISLVGYSEGGYATLATQQKLEAETIIPIKKVISGAGAYNKTSFTKSLLASDQELPFIGNYLWVLDVYNSIYPELKRPWSDYVNEPYATQLTSYGEINTIIPDSLLQSTNPKDLFTSSFVSGIIEDTDTAFLNVLQDNDVHDWTPKAPVFLFHGTEDKLILPFVSESTAEALTSNGGTVAYTSIEGKDHNGAVVPFFVSALSLLNQEEE